MAGACQLAGFPSVVGTLWQVSDEFCAALVGCFYRSILDDHGKLDYRQVANGLHFSLRKVREDAQKAWHSRQPDDAWLWAPYIHVGA